MAARGAMLARPIEQVPEAGACPGGCRYEPKWDGWRCLAAVGRAGDVRLTSRHGTVLTSAFPEVAEAVADQLPAGTLVDGELIRVHPDGRPDFAALARRVGGGRRAAALAVTAPCALVGFDVLHVAGQDITVEPLSHRRATLERILAGSTGRLELTLHTADRAEAMAWLDVIPRLGIEGLVIKAAASRYRGGTRGWWKYKPRVPATAIVTGATGSLSRPTGLLLGQSDAAGRLRMVGRSTVLSRGQAELIGPLLAAAGDEHPWPLPLPAGWVGGLPGEPSIDFIPVVPDVEAQVLVEAAAARTRWWRHPVRLVAVHHRLAP